MVSKFHSSLLQDLLSMLNDADDRNVIIRVGENQDKKEFRAHSSILRARSTYFKSAFSSNWISKKDDMIEFEKPNIKPYVFEILLKYIYTGEVDLTILPVEDILGLLVASDELLLEELFKHIQNHLIEKQKTWIQQNFALVLHSVFKLTNCKQLQDHCLDVICAHPLPFFSSNDIPSMDMSIVYGLLKRDDLQVEEIVAWDFLIKWGIKQTPGLENKNNRDEWTNENYEDLKNTLSEFIHLIRFTDINSKDFFDKVRPYRAIFPNRVYEEIEEFYYKDTLPKTLPPRIRKSYIGSMIIKPKLASIILPRIGKSYIGSMIIKPKLASIIFNWMENKNPKATRGKNDSLYKFDLLYRGDHDNISSDSFKDKCYRQLPCLILVNVRSSSKIFGGYSPTGVYFCDGDAWHLTSDSFIFSFESSGDIKKMQISRVQNQYHALYEFYDCAFNFGGGALTMDNDKNLHVYDNLDYEPLNVNASYAIKEVEAFRVVKQ